MEGKSQNSTPPQTNVVARGAPQGKDIVVPQDEREVPAPARQGFALFDYVTSGALTIPKTHRDQKAFFRFLQRAGSDPLLVEQIHALRDSIVLSAIREKNSTGGLTIAVMGVKGGEGTSLVSLLLSLALGDCTSRQVAFLDGRFNVQRFEILAEILGLSKDSVSIRSGFSDIAGFYNERHRNVYFLQNVAGERNMQFFSDKRLGFFLADLRQRFDFTVLDLPALLKDTVSVFVLPHVDRLYLVTEAGRTRLAEVQRCIDLCQQAGRQLNGVIINKQDAPFWTRFLWREIFY